MSVWVYIVGAVISGNCLTAWASHSHGAKCLAMWVASAYGLGLLLMLIAPAMLPELFILDFPWANVLGAGIDLFLLAWLLKIITRNDDLISHWRPLVVAQFSTIILHAFDVATRHIFDKFYYGALDAILLSIIFMNIIVSVRHGISVGVLLPWLHNNNRHRSNHS